MNPVELAKRKIASSHHDRMFSRKLRETLSMYGKHHAMKEMGPAHIQIHLDGGVYLYVHVEGAVGLEDHRVERIVFGEKDVVLRNPHRALVFEEHKSKRFGDVEMTSNEKWSAQNEVIFQLEMLLE